MIEFKPHDEIGAYRVIKLLGVGGVGAVYEVEHRQLGVRYAMKTFTLENEHVDVMKGKFLSEGKVLARLNHPNIVRVFDLDFDERTRTPYFVMDLVRFEAGKTSNLAEVVTSELEEDRIAAWFSELASALDYIHSHGIVHRDVKLNNVLLDSEGHAVLSDFGISRFVSVDLRRDLNAANTIVTTVPEHRLLMGTRGYMAPELEDGGKATAAADTYALGVMVLYLLTGVWYERGSKALNLLEMFERPWGKVLPQMLDPDPDRRPIVLVGLSKIVAADKSVCNDATAFRIRLNPYVWSCWKSRLAVAMASLAGCLAVGLCSYLLLKPESLLQRDLPSLDELVCVDEIYERNL